MQSEFDRESVTSLIFKNVDEKDPINFVKKNKIDLVDKKNIIH